MTPKFKVGDKVIDKTDGKEVTIYHLGCFVQGCTKVHDKFIYALAEGEHFPRGYIHSKNLRRTK